MSGEIVRACDADRERFSDHLAWLCAKGYITEPEAQVLRAQIHDARSMAVLKSTLGGLPLPPAPDDQAKRRDWGVPRNFLPPCVGAASAGLLIAALPTTALAHRHDSLSNVISVLCIVVGILMIVTSIITTACAGVAWDSEDNFEKKQRRERDARRRA